MGLHERLIKYSREQKQAAETLEKAIGNFKRVFAKVYIIPVLDWLTKVLFKK